MRWPEATSLPQAHRAASRTDTQAQVWECRARGHQQVEPHGTSLQGRGGKSKGCGQARCQARQVDRALEPSRPHSAVPSQTHGQTPRAGFLWG